MKDEFEIARIRVGVTKTKELNSHMQPEFYKGPPGYQIEEGDLTLHYYTTDDRKAVLCAASRKGVVRNVRLKLGFWGPLKELKKIPPEALSQCSLEVLGTYHGVHVGYREGGFMDMFHGRQRVTEVYGPPTFDEGDVIRYDWLFGETPRRLHIQCDGERGITELYLELLEPVEATGIRPVAPAQPFQRLPNLSPELNAKMEEGERHLSEGRAAEAQKLFDEVQKAITGDEPWLHDINVEVGTRQWMARAAQGDKRAIERLEGLLKHLTTYASYNPPEVLRIRLALGQARHRFGQTEKARQELTELWNLLQVSDYYDKPEPQYLVRCTADELEKLGEPRYAAEIRRQDAAR